MSGGSPLVRAMRQADRYLTALPSARDRLGWAHRTVPAFFLAEGEAFTELVPFVDVDAANPSGHFAVPGQCFANSAALASEEPGRLLYCEGYAMRQDGRGIPVHHAWVVDAAGRVIDTTWARQLDHAEDPEGYITPEEGRHYWGVPIPHDVHQLWMQGTGRVSLMTDRRWSSQTLMRLGLVEGFKRHAYLADREDPEWLCMVGVLRPQILTTTWDEQRTQYTATGPPGISYCEGDFSHLGLKPVLCLCWRDDQGVLRGVLNYFQEDSAWQQMGTVNVLVDPDWQRRGIGGQLFTEGIRRFNIDLGKQRFTREGLAGTRRLMEKGELPREIGPQLLQPTY